MYKLTKHHRSKIHRWNGTVQNEAQLNDTYEKPKVEVTVCTT